MSSVNKCIIVGRVGKTPEIRHTQTGQTVASFSVATDESYKDKAGNKIEATEWHNVTAWGKTADFVGSYLDKGRLVYIEGKLKTEKYADKNGVEKYTTKIIADRVQGLDKRQEGGMTAAPVQEAGPVRADMTELDGAPF